MSNFKSLNGYDVEDTDARNSIATLQETINATGTGLSDRVGSLETNVSNLITQESSLEDDIDAINTNLATKFSMDNMNKTMIRKNNLTQGANLVGFGSYPGDMTDADTFVLGHYTIYDSNGDRISKQSINTTLINETTKEILANDEIGYYSDNGNYYMNWILYVYDPLWVGGSVEVTLVRIKY